MVGVHIVGHDAGEMIQAIGIAVTMGATKADFDRTIAVHPTAAEELVTMRTPFVVKSRSLSDDAGEASRAFVRAYPVSGRRDPL